MYGLQEVWEKVTRVYKEQKRREYDPFLESVLWDVVGKALRDPSYKLTAAFVVDTVSLETSYAHSGSLQNGHSVEETALQRFRKKNGRGNYPDTVVISVFSPPTDRPSEKQQPKWADLADSLGIGSIHFGYYDSDEEEKSEAYEKMRFDASHPESYTLQSICANIAKLNAMDPESPGYFDRRQKILLQSRKLLAGRMIERGEKPFACLPS